MNKIRDILKGKKTYITAIIGVLGALVAWGDGHIDLTGLIAAAWAAAQTCFIRAGVATEVQRAQDHRVTTLYQTPSHRISPRSG